MAESFRLSVVTGDGTVFVDTVEYVNLPTGFGSLGVMAKHAPMLCAVEKGVVRCTKDGETIRIRVGGGVASVENNEATLLVSDGERLE
ncbi:MAG: F0F1 ATP synthase subunit epsilon [Eubacteriales bacterium]|nr:F0F1 ATP synthase subunit epsilon [Eubacteriales bacterium]